MEYDAIVVPGCETLRKTTLERLEQFRENGGKLIFMGDAPSLVDPVWGDEVPVSFVDVPSRAVWAEAVGGVRAEIVKNFYMGWSLRYKYLFLKGNMAHGGPWYIPGFGTGKKTSLGATYTLSYYFNLSKKK